MGYPLRTKASSLEYAGPAPDKAQRRAAYAELIQRHEAALLRTARRLCGGEENDAHDCVQEALVRGYEAYVQGQFREGSNERAWLLRILTNVFLNHYRKRRKFASEVDLEAFAEGEKACLIARQAATANTPEAALMAATLDEPLERALGALTDELRVCITLVDIEGLEYAETASILNIPIGTVRSRLSRARLLLHELLYHYARDRRRV